MKLVLGTIAIVVFVVSCSTSSYAEDANTSVDARTADQQVLSRERDYTNGILHHDIKLLESVFARSFVDTGSDGVLRTRQQMLDLIGRSSPVANIEENNRRIDIYGSVAVVTVKFTLSGNDQGKLRTFHGRATDVWVLKSGTWLCVAAHSSELRQ